MSKKMLKRSLALGALMAFVITGSAMAADVDRTLTTLPTITAADVDGLKQGNYLDGIDGGAWNAFYPNNNKFELSDKLVTNGDITYSGGPLGLYAAYRIENKVSNKYEPHLDNPNNNILEIKHNVTAQGEINLYAATVGWGKEEPQAATGNVILVGTSDRQITITSENGGIYIGGAYGQSPLANSNGKHDLSGNEAIVKNVIFKGNKIGIYGGDANGGSANNNKISIVDTNIDNAEICGGIVQTTIGDANSNTISIEGNSKISGEIYGSYNSTSGSVSNNTIILKDNADVSNANLYGSNKEGTGNTLNFASGWTGKAQSIKYFNEINIGEATWGKPVAEVDSLVLTDTKVNVDKVRVAGGGTSFAAGAYSPLITSEDPIDGNVAGGNAKVFKGVATIYEASIQKASDQQSVGIQLGTPNTATYNAGEMNPQVLVIGESRAAATAFTNQGSELIETGLDALARDKAEAGDTKAFAAVYGSTSEFATGSEVKVNGWSGIVGVGKTNANGLTVGAFFENGEGNYRTYNTVNNDFMRGDGEACYNGGGLLLRKDNANGVYTEASLRAGNLQNELRNAVRGSEGLAGYDIDTFYYGAHVGVGKIIPRGNEGDSIDVYGKFIYTHHDSEDFTIDGDEFHFDSVESERLRLGFRINEVQTNKLSMYYGAAWEYEFGGDADNTVVGYDLSTPFLEGSTVIGEVGMHYNASEKWSLDLNARAYSGQREGWTGSVQANYSF